MLKTFSVSNYRGFHKLELTGLGRINLLVGLNNSGKTSFLRAINRMDEFVPGMRVDGFHWDVADLDPETAGTMQTTAGSASTAIVGRSHATC